MSQQAYWFKSNGDYVVAHNGGKNYHINNFKDIFSVAQYLSKFSADKADVKVDPELPPNYEPPEGTKIEFPTYWEVHMLRDMMDAPEAFENLEDHADIEEIESPSILSSTITTLTSIIKF